MPDSKRTFFLAWLLIIVVGAYVTYQDPVSERNWTGYAYAMALMPLAFVLLGLMWAAMKAAILGPYLLIRYILDKKAPRRWYSEHWNWYSFKRMFIWRDFSCFFIPDIMATDNEEDYHQKHSIIRTKAEYEKLKKQGKL